jgi:predicted phage tail component-like protein
MTIGTVMTFGGTASDSFDGLLIARVSRPLRGEVRDDIVQVPGREGFWLFEEKPGQRIITVSMSILGDDFETRRQTVIDVADWLDQAGLQELIFDDESDRFHLGKLAKAPDPDEWLNHAGFEVDFICEPYSYATTISEENLVCADGVVETFIAPDKVEGVPVVEVTAKGGDLEGFELNFNDEVLVYGDTLAQDATITISTLSYTVTTGTNQDIDLEGFFDPDDLNMVNVSGDFPIIVTGTNSVTVDYGVGSLAGTVEVDVYWRRRSR